MSVKLARWYKGSREGKKESREREEERREGQMNKRWTNPFQGFLEEIGGLLCVSISNFAREKWSRLFSKRL